MHFQDSRGKAIVRNFGPRALQLDLKCQTTRTPACGSQFDRVGCVPAVVGRACVSAGTHHSAG